MSVSQGFWVMPNWNIRSKTHRLSAIYPSGLHSVLAVNEYGKWYGWGSNQYNLITSTGSLYYVYPRSADTIQTLQDSNGFNKLTLGNAHAAYLDASNNIFCWGRSNRGQIGNGGSATVSTPYQHASILNATNAIAYGDTTMGFGENGSGYDRRFGWGNNAFGQLGSSAISLTQLYNPYELNPIENGIYVVGRLTGGSYQDLLYGLVGSTGTLLTPNYSLDYNSTGTSHVGGQYHIIGLSGTTAYGWHVRSSGNALGQLGLGDYSNHTSPASITTDVAQIAAGGFHTAILKTDKTLWLCGSNSNGQLAQPVTTTRSNTLLQVPGTWEYVACGYLQTYAIDGYGALWAWGYAANGALGNGATAGNYFTPQLIMEAL